MNDRVKKLQDLIDKSGVNQADLSRLSGVTESNISLILSGKTKRPHKATLDSLFTALDKQKEERMTLDKFADWFESLPAARKVSVWGMVKGHVEQPTAVENSNDASPVRTPGRTG